MRKGLSDRLTAAALLLAVVAGLLLSSTPRAIGDADEYLVTAGKLAALEWPSFSRGEVEQLNPGIKWVETRNGRFETVHFWVYPLIAVPALWLGERFGYSPEWGFTAVNLAFFAALAAVAIRRAWTGAALLVLLSPIVWWLDKPHPEVFTFSLLGLSMLTVRDRPILAMLCASLAATQNPPIAALIGLIVLMYPAARRMVWITAAVWLAALHPLYYLWRIGRTTALVEGDIRIPPLTRYGTVLWDLNLGLAANAPLFVLAALLAAVLFWRGWLSHRREVVFAALAGAWLLFAFTQAINLNHGGTPSMSRYALWLIPLAFVVLPEAESPAGPRLARALTGLAIASIVWSIAYFHPRLPEGHLRPTRLAMWQWTRHPGWQNPVPEVFAERLRGQDAVNELATTPGCEKALIQAGAWPHPCTPSELPERCAQPDTWCYANRTAEGYDFVQVPRRGGYRFGWPMVRGR